MKASADGTPTAPRPADTIRILHLEDDPVSSRLVSEQLRRDGLQVEIERVDTLSDFAKHLAARDHDLILSDFTIPGMDTFEALNLAHRRRPDLPYLFFSGTLGEEAAIEALKQGASDYVLKDRPARLPTAVRRALREATGQVQTQAPETKSRFPWRPLGAAPTQVGELFPAPRSWYQAPPACYACAVLAVLAAWAVRLGLDPYLGDLQPFAVFFVPVVLVSWLAGPGPGTFAAVLGWFLGDYFFCSPRHHLLVLNAPELVSSLVYVVVCAALISITHHLRRGREQLRASQERFRLFMDHTPSLAWVKDEAGRYVFINQAYEQRFHVRLAECQGKTDEQLWGLETAARLRQADQAVLAAGHPLQITEHTIEPDGRPSFWHNTKFVFRDYSGRRFVASLGLDITEQKHIEEQLRASEQRLQKAMATPTVGVLYFDLNGHIHGANTTFERMCGYRTEELRTLDWKALTAPEFLETTMRVAAQLAQRGEVAPYEKQMVRKDGSRWWGLFAPVRLSGSGTNSECMEFIIDITDRQRAEEALRHSEVLARQRAEALAAALTARDQALAQLNALLENAPLGFAFFDRARRFTRINRFLARHINGLAVEDHLGRSAQEVQLGSAQSIDRLLDMVFELGQPMENVVLTGETRTAPGEPRHWLTAWFPVRTPDGRVPWAGVFVLDITGQKRTEQALRQAREQLRRANVDLDQLVQERTAKLRETVAELEGFSYSLVHDMRAPLRAMLAYAGILESEAGPRLEAAHTELLRRIGVAAHRMDQLVIDSLNYSRILRQELPLGPINLGALLRGMVETYPNLHPPQAHVDIHLDNLTVHGNEAALTQVFSNLLGNAVKFVASGVHPNVRVWAETRQCPAEFPGAARNCALVYVQDNGIGIPPDQQEHIFGMFQRLHRADEYPGTGIGLALVKKSLERTGGQITLESTPGQGTRFCVQLPLELPPETESRKQA